jgi:hypothetical protein
MLKNAFMQLLISVTVMFCFSNGAVAAVVVNGALDGTYPVWNRISDRPDGLGGYVDSANDAIPYEVLEVQSPVVGDILTASVQGGTQFDSFLALYTSFNPLIPATGILAVDDDGAGYPHASLSKSGLSANTSYYLVISSYSASVDPVYPLYGGYLLSLGGSFSVVPQATVTTLNAVPESITAGQSVTLTATITKLAGSAPPTGSVTFKEGVSLLGSGSLNGAGQASLVLSTLAVGTHSITAEYSGETKYGASASAPVSVLVNPIMRQLTVTLFGTGNGSLASDANHAGIACPDMCQATFTDGAVLALTPFPAVTSVFSGWNGTCGGDPCQVTMNGDKAVTAIFDLAQVRNATSKTNYATLSEALVAAATGNELLLQGMQYNGAVSLNDGVTLSGRWDAAFGSPNGKATLLADGLSVKSGNSRVTGVTVKGKLTVNGGSLRTIGVAVLP